MRGTNGILMKRFSLAIVAAALAVMASASPAAASVTIGQLAPGVAPIDECNLGPFDAVQPTVTSGNTYVVPPTVGTASWVVTSWSHNASATANQSLSMKLYRPAGGVSYTVIGQDGPRSPNYAELNTFTGLHIPVQPGDILGIAPTGMGGNNACSFAVPGDHWIYHLGSLAVGQTDTFPSTRSNQRLNVSATLEPDCDKDGLGDESQDKDLRPCDKTPPQTVISAKKIKDDTARFTFSSNEPGSTFQCKLDKRKFKSCKSPKKYKDLSAGKHKFKVRAVDASGNVDATPAKKKFTI